jgi:hypothetical protein
VISISILLSAALLANLQESRAATNGTTDANQLVREVIQNEIQAEASNNNLWSYRELTKRKGRELLLGYCQTEQGTVHHALAVNGQPLNSRQRQS